MAVMGKKVWAVVCGAIRQEFEFYTTLAMLCDYRSKDLLEGIVISTWKGEIENIPRLREKLQQLDVFTVELDPLDESLSQFMHMGYARQAYQLKNGLDFVPDDVFVLKCRTDFVIDKVDLAKEVLKGNINFSIGSFGALQTGLRYRIAVMRYSATAPFLLLDGCFVGYKQDLYKTVNFESTSVRYKNFIIPDLSFFLSIFIGQFPIISQFCTFFDYRLLFDPVYLSNKIKLYLNSANEEQKRNFVLPSLLNKIFALYFVLLYNCFYRFDCRAKNFPIKELDLISVLSLDTKIGMNGDWPTAFVNIEVFKMIVEGECKPTKAYITLYKEICKIAMPGYAEKLFFSDEEIDEFIDWMKGVLNYNPQQLIRNRMVPLALKNDINYAEAIDILFDDFHFNAQMRDVIYTIAYDRSRWCYHIVVENLNKVRRYNHNMYQIMLGSACRIEHPAILKITAKMIYNNKIDEKYLQNACFVFDKWANYPTHFYTFPMHPYKISAFYWYGKYAESIGKNTMPKVFYSRLIQNFKLSPRPEPLSYADAVLELIKEIVSIHFDDYLNNSSVHNMLDFLVDDFGREAFTVEQWDVLTEYALTRKYSIPFKTADEDAFERLLEGAKNTESVVEARIISRLLLREKWNFREYMVSADIAINMLFERYSDVISCFSKANVMKENEALTFNPDELESNDDFVLLVRILAERKLLSRNKTIFLDLFGQDIFRRMILELFLYLEGNARVKFFSMKNGVQAWINYNDFSRCIMDSELIKQRNIDWWSWPFLDSASPSAFAAFIKADCNKIYTSIEINSCPCSAKSKLLGALDKSKINAFNSDDRVIRLRTASYKFESVDEIKEAVGNALNDFYEIGELLVDAANKACKAEKK